MACKRSSVRFRYPPPRFDFSKMKYYVYIIQSKKNGKFYIGFMDDVERRITQHNSGRNKSTKSGVPWELKLKEEFDNRKSAMNREKQIKDKKSRKYIEWLIKSKE